MPLPQTQKGYWIGLEGKEFRDVPVEEPEEGEILIRNVAVASNPKDWKLVHMFGWEGIQGNDVAGIVVAVGEGVTDFKVGDKVAAMTKLLVHPKYGAYQFYTIASADVAFHIPEGMSFEQAATIPLCYTSACMALFEKLFLPTPWDPIKPEEKFPIIIYGAVSSCGSFAVQLAKQAGLEVIGVVKSNEELARQLGCDEVINCCNMSSEEITSALLSALDGRSHLVTKAYDTIAEVETLTPLVDFFCSLPRNGAEDKIVANLFTNVPAPDDGSLNILRMTVSTAYETGLTREWFDYIVKENKIKPHRVEVIPGGLKGVEEGLRRLEHNEVDACKLVYRMEETGDI
ncbi:GroES-like protein [Atractiella rhizophila]|nr:GroES-like protein [Atractiella rhizophila]